MQLESNNIPLSGVRSHPFGARAFTQRVCKHMKNSLPANTVSLCLIIFNMNFTNLYEILN